MKTGQEYTPSYGVFTSVKPMMHLFSNALTLFTVAVCAAAPFALVALAIYGGAKLLTLSTVLTVAAVFLAAAYFFGPSDNNSKALPAHVDLGPTW